VVLDKEAVRNPRPDAADVVRLLMRGQQLFVLDPLVADAAPVAIRVLVLRESVGAQVLPALEGFSAHVTIKGPHVAVPDVVPA
jgi:hypothetical protein